MCVLFSGCATTKTYKPSDKEIGTLTYDEAISKMEVPDKIEKGDRVIVAFWGREYTTTGSFLVIPFYSRVRKKGVQMTFNKETQLLIDYREF